MRKNARDEFRQDVWDELAAAMHYVSTDFADDDGEDALAAELTRLDEEHQLGGNRVYYSPSRRPRSRPSSRRSAGGAPRPAGRA